MSAPKILSAISTHLNRVYLLTPHYFSGDAQYKPYVTARPETATVDLDGDEDFVVVACDGLWDFVSEDDVALAVYRQLDADPGKYTL